MDRNDPAYNGQTRLQRGSCSTPYDPLVLGPIARFVWRCPTSRLLERYRRHIRARHLDVGPGTGYFLERRGPAGRQPGHDPRPEHERPQRMSPAGCGGSTSPPSRPTSSSRSPSTDRSTPRRCTWSSTACRGRSRARLPPSPTWPPSSRRRVSCSERPCLGRSGQHTWAAQKVPRCLQPAGWLRQPRRHRGRAPRHPRGIVRARGDSTSIGSAAVFAATNPRRQRSS